MKEEKRGAKMKMRRERILHLVREPGGRNMRKEGSFGPFREIGGGMRMKKQGSFGPRLEIGNK